MARKNSHRAKKANTRPKKGRAEAQRGRAAFLPPLAMIDGLSEAEDALKEGHLDDAAAVLETLARRYPRRCEVLDLLLDVHRRREDMWACQDVCQRILKIDPQDEDIWLVLAGAAISNLQPAIARSAFDNFIRRWPTSPLADEARLTLAGIESFLRSEVAKRGLPESEGFELMLAHDETYFYLHQGQYGKVCETAERLLRRWPTFAPALNNRSEAQFQLGRLDLAIADARRVLEFDADNFHALANLSRYQFLSGQFSEAGEFLERLKAVKSDAAELHIKQAETLALVGDWPGVLDALEKAERRCDLDLLPNGALLYHFAGVAAANLDQVDVARKHWMQAIRFGLSTSWAQENLDDLKLPVGQQYGPWAFPITHWIPEPVIERLSLQLERAGRRAKEADIRRQVRKFLESHQYLELLAPELLKHGDPAAKEFTVRMAGVAQLPSMTQALRDFAFGRRGPDSLRHQAAIALQAAGELPPGAHPMWIQGELHDVILMSFEITEEPTGNLSKQVEQLATEAYHAIHDNDDARAEALLDKALRLHPEEPSLVYNRAVAIESQGRQEEALSIVRNLHAQHPDYLFASLRLAQEAVAGRDLDAARALLQPLLERRRFHISEYTGLCNAHIELLRADGNIEGARAWLKMWQDVDPDDRRIKVVESRLNRRGLLSWLKR